MGQAAFFRDEAKKRAAETVKAVELQTSAEVVIAVRKRASDYRAADYHFGLLLLVVVVIYMLVSPQVFEVEMIVFEGFGAFVFGVLVSANIAPVRRLLLRGKMLGENVQTAAHATFYELGISRTSARNGILVFVSAFERRCAVVPDIGIDEGKLGSEYKEALGAIASAAKKMDLDAFLASVEKLGPVLGKAMPRSADDVNELPDEVQ
jgi:putative membrane protein